MRNLIENILWIFHKTPHGWTLHVGKEYDGTREISYLDLSCNEND